MYKFPCGISLFANLTPQPILQHTPPAATTTTCRPVGYADNGLSRCFFQINIDVRHTCVMQTQFHHFHCPTVQSVADFEWIFQQQSFAKRAQFTRKTCGNPRKPRSERIRIVRRDDNTLYCSEKSSLNFNSVFFPPRLPNLTQQKIALQRYHKKKKNTIELKKTLLLLTRIKVLSAL